jgi:hypothetical protein
MPASISRSAYCNYRHVLGCGHNDQLVDPPGAHTEPTSGRRAKLVGIELLTRQSTMRREGVNDEGCAHESPPSRYMVEIADLQLGLLLCDELAVNLMKQERRNRTCNRSSRDLSAHNAEQSSFAHQVRHSEAGHIRSFAPRLAPHFVDTENLQDFLRDRSMSVESTPSCRTCTHRHGGYAAVLRGACGPTP